MKIYVQVILDKSEYHFFQPAYKLYKSNTVKVFINNDDPS